MTNPNPAFTLLGDEPYRTARDPLGYDALAGELANLVIASRGSTPLAVGIEGDWGAGKSTLMRMLEAQLRQRIGENDVRAVWFNAWKAEGRSESHVSGSRAGGVLESLIKSVLDQMDPNALRRAMRSKNVQRGVRIGASLAARWFGVGRAVDELWEAMQVDARVRQQLQDVIGEVVQQWLDAGPRVPGGADGNGVPRRIVAVFIDDLDRCSPAGVFDVFEAVKLYLNVPGFVFIVGYDKSVISQAILAQKMYAVETTPGRYLEKIIQISFRLPRPRKEEARALIDIYVQNSGLAGVVRTDAEKTLVVEQNGRNPRRIKRFINRFVMEYGLDREAKDLSPDLLIKALIVEEYFRDFERVFREESDAVQQFKDFCEARRIIRFSEWQPGDLVEQVFRQLGGDPPERETDRGVALAALEKIAPEEFVQLARNDGFVELIASLEVADHERLRWRILRTRKKQEAEAKAAAVETPASAAPESVAARATAPPRALEGMRILWVDPNPQNNTALTAELKAQGAIVTAARSAPEAESYLDVSEGESMVDIDGQKFDLLISSFSRGESRPDGGADEVREYRRGKHYAGPVIFYTARVSAARRELAAALNAEVTNDPGVVLRRARELHQLRVEWSDAPKVKMSAQKSTQKSAPA